MSEPTLTNVEITASTGGRVQIVKFNLQNEFGFGYTEKYTIPIDWSEERIETWQHNKMLAIKARVDEFAQVEQDALLEQSDWAGD